MIYIMFFLLLVMENAHWMYLALKTGNHIFFKVISQKRCDW